jgi:hypothetical protein
VASRRPHPGGPKSRTSPAAAAAGAAREVTGAVLAIVLSAVRTAPGERAKRNLPMKGIARAALVCMRRLTADSPEGMTGRAFSTIHAGLAEPAMIVRLDLVRRNGAP